MEELDNFMDELAYQWALIRLKQQEKCKIFRSELEIAYWKTMVMKLRPYDGLGRS